MIATLAYFILALVLLVMFHELGHFLVARLLGVKVLRFSFGFGKILASWHDKKGTEYAWSLVPLGGYVKMLDESEGEVPESERHLAFNNKPLWVRTAIVLAGPLFNFVFAFAALWLVLVIGIHSLAPMIDGIVPNSIAAKAGLAPNQEVTALNGKKIESWQAFQYALMPFLGTDEPIKLQLQSLETGLRHEKVLSLSSWQLDAKKPALLTSLGIIPFIPKILPVVETVVSRSPAQAVGLMKGDRILSIDGLPVADWLTLVEYIRTHPDKMAHLVIKRQHEVHTITVHLGKIIQNGKTAGFLGVKSPKVEWPPNWLRIERQAPVPALAGAFMKTAQLTNSTFTLLGRLIVGKLPWQSISGPVGIAQGAGESARSGLSYYLSFLALVSISLGVLNLLPIPILDGGHLLYYAIELIRRRPLSEEIKLAGAYLGLGLLSLLMIVALTNDIARLAG